MITKNNIVSGVICGGICVVFMWVYMHFAMGNMNMGDNKMFGMMHKMSDGSMMMNDGSMMDMGDMTMGDMVNDLKGKAGKNLEKAFISGMIPHHQGAVDMAKFLLQDKTISPDLKKFAEQIISAQEGEIKMMNDWMKNYK